jgi:hypothetical protein
MNTQINKCSLLVLVNHIGGISDNLDPPLLNQKHPVSVADTLNLVCYVDDSLVL